MTAVCPEEGKQQEKKIILITSRVVLSCYCCVTVLSRYRVTVLSFVLLLCYRDVVGFSFMFLFISLFQ